MAELWSDDRSFYIKPTTGGKTRAWACRACAAVVIDQAVHEKFHRDVIEDALNAVSGMVQQAWQNALHQTALEYPQININRHPPG